LDSFINQKQEVMTPIYPKQDPEYRTRVLGQFYKRVTDTKWPDEDEKGKPRGRKAKIVEKPKAKLRPGEGYNWLK
jgi:hypothetical protein